MKRGKIMLTREIDDKNREAELIVATSPNKGIKLNLQLFGTVKSQKIKVYNAFHAVPALYDINPSKIFLDDIIKTEFGYKIQFRLEDTRVILHEKNINKKTDILSCHFRLADLSCTFPEPTGQLRTEIVTRTAGFPLKSNNTSKLQYVITQESKKPVFHCDRITETDIAQQKVKKFFVGRGIFSSSVAKIIESYIQEESIIDKQIDISLQDVSSDKNKVKNEKALLAFKWVSEHCSGLSSLDISNHICRLYSINSLWNNAATTFKKIVKMQDDEKKLSRKSF